MGETQSTMWILLMILPFLLSAVGAQGPPQPHSKSQDLVCDICIEAVTQFDEWLTEDSTETEIIHWVEQICGAISHIVPVGTCKLVIEFNLPSIIDGLVNDYLKPKDVCITLTACSTGNISKRFKRLL